MPDARSTLRTVTGSRTLMVEGVGGRGGDCAGEWSVGWSGEFGGGGCGVFGCGGLADRYMRACAARACSFRTVSYKQCASASMVALSDRYWKLFT